MQTVQTCACFHCYDRCYSACFHCYNRCYSMAWSDHMLTVQTCVCFHCYNRCYSMAWSDHMLTVQTCACFHCYNRCYSTAWSDNMQTVQTYTRFHCYNRCYSTAWSDKVQTVQTCACFHCYNRCYSMAWSDKVQTVQTCACFHCYNRCYSMAWSDNVQTVQTCAERDNGHRGRLAHGVLPHVVQTRQDPAHAPISSTHQDLVVGDVTEHIQPAHDRTQSMCITDSTQPMLPSPPHTRILWLEMLRNTCSLHRACCASLTASSPHSLHSSITRQLYQLIKIGNKNDCYHSESTSKHRNIYLFFKYLNPLFIMTKHNMQIFRPVLDTKTTQRNSSTKGKQVSCISFFSI